MNVAIRITEADRLVIASELTKMLADETVLYIKTKNAHWNVEGPSFNAIHKFFEAQFEQLDEIIDDVAAQTRPKNKRAPEFSEPNFELLHLTDESIGMNDNQCSFKDHLEDHESIILNLRENIKNYANENYYLGTNDFITGLVETHEKMSWFLRAHVVK